MGVCPYRRSRVADVPQNLGVREMINYAKRRSEPGGYDKSHRRDSGDEATATRFRTRAPSPQGVPRHADKPLHLGSNQRRLVVKDSQTTEIEESEFGKGYAYCLGLFLAHEWKMFSDKSKAKEWAEKHPGDIQVYEASSWFNGAADHLFELEIPAALPDEEKAGRSISCSLSGLPSLHERRAV